MPATSAPLAGDLRASSASVGRRAAVLFGLAAVAVTQPLLDLFGRNPEFFVAGRYSTAQILLLAGIIAAVPAGGASLLVAAATRIDQRAGRITFLALAGMFGALLVMAILRSSGVDALAPVLIGAVAGGLLVSWLVGRTRGGLLLASYLGLAGAFFLASFVFMSPAADLIIGDGAGDLGRVELDAPGGPVVWVILDEFPVASLLDADGEINADRYPGFAALASVSTWYRNASSPHNNTHRALPAQLTGVRSAGETLPRFQDHPRNLFTLFGDRVPIRRYESVTDLCPPSLCEPQARRPLSQAVEDAAVVYGHRVLPATWRRRLPDIATSWGDFGAEDDGGSVAESTDEESLVDVAYRKWRLLGADEKSPLGQAGVLRERIDAIAADPALHFIHVALPHRPWVLAPSGRASSFSPELIEDPDAPGYAWGARLDFQLSAMQIGATDVLVNDLVVHLRALPTWDDTTLIVTSDHGTNLTPPDIGRTTVTAANREEVFRVPLFVKGPGQTSGERSDVSASTLDLLPTLIDLLGATTDWTFDGHSLLDGSEPAVEPRVSTEVDPLLDVAARRAEEFPHGTDWTALAAVGPHGHLVGRDVADLTVGEPSTLRVRLDQANLFGDLPTDEGTAPFVLAGVVAGGEPPADDLLVAVNGRVAGVLGGYRRDDGGFAFNGFVGDVYRDGANEVTVYEVTGDGGAAVLHAVAG